MTNSISITVFDQLLPEELRHDVFQYYHARNIAIFSVCLLPVGFFYGALYAHNGFALGAWLLFSCSLLDIMALGILRWGKSVSLSGFLVTFAVYLAVCGLALVTGGAYSPSIVWLAIVPIMAMMMNGPIHCVAWAFIVTTSLVGFHVADQIWGPLPDWLPYDVMSGQWKRFQTFSTVGFILFILIVTLVTEKSKSNAFQQMEAARGDAQQKMEELHRTHTHLQEAHDRLQTSEEELKQYTEELRRLNQRLELTRKELEWALKSEKETSKALLHSEAKYRSIMEKANEAIVITRGDHVLIHNPKLEEMTGYSSEELMSLPLYKFIHPQDRQKLWLSRQQLPNSDLYVQMEFRIVCKNGEIRWVGTVTNPIEWEGQPAFQDFLEDITDRKVAEEKLKRYEVIISTASELMALVDRHYTYQAVNHAFAKIAGRPEEQIVGLPVSAIMGEELFEKELKQRFDACFLGAAVRYQRWFELLGNPPMFLDIFYQPVVEADQTVSGVVVVGKDITDLKNAEDKLYMKNEALNASLKELQQTITQLSNAQNQLISAEKMASLGQLTAGIAHEINNPVNFISGNISPLLRDLEDLQSAFEQYQACRQAAGKQAAFEDLDNYLAEIDPPFLFEEMASLINGIREGANRTKEIVMGLRNFSRLDEDEVKIADVNAALDSTLTLLHNQLKYRISVEKDYGELPPIECYPGKLNQVFMNIINNAQQAIEDKGTIRIATRYRAGKVEIRISDTGKGMSEKVKPKIFEPFFTTKDVGQGTGLGLSISYGIIQQHHGTIEVESAEGKGSTFLLVLPEKLSG